MSTPNNVVDISRYKAAPLIDFLQNMLDCFRAGIPLVSLWRVGAIRPLDEAGTHRSDSQIIAQRRRNPLPLGRGGCQNNIVRTIGGLRILEHRLIKKVEM